MTAAERGLLLLCCPLGEPDAPVLTMAQFRTLSVRAHAQASRPGDPLRELTARDVQTLGYGADAAAFSPYLTELRAAMRRDTEEKIAAGK